MANDRKVMGLNPAGMKWCPSHKDLINETQSGSFWIRVVQPYCQLPHVATETLSKEALF